MHSLIDLHCHLDLYPDPQEHIDALCKSGSYVLSVTTTPKAWRRTSQLANGNERIRTALGLHPQLAKNRSGELALFEHLLSQTEYVGEIGLDGSRDFRESLAIQERLFTAILDMCNAKNGRILSVHSRGATRRVLELLDPRLQNNKVVLHWFTGSPGDLVRAIDLGCWFSIGPAMLASNKSTELISSMPLNRILTETDGPFGHYEGSPLRPADVRPMIQFLAVTFDYSVSEIQQHILQNFRTLVS